MEANGQNTTSAYAMRLRSCVPVFAGMPARSRSGNHTVAVGGNVLPRGIAGAGEQGVGIRVFATGGDV